MKNKEVGLSTLIIYLTLSLLSGLKNDNDGVISSKSRRRYFLIPYFAFLISDFVSGVAR